MVEMKNFKRVALFTSSKDTRAKVIADQIQEILINLKCQVLYDESFKRHNKDGLFKTSKKNTILKNSDLVIAIGGDGAMLSCSREYGANGLPILGINLGKLGFLTDIAPKEIATKLIEVLNGSYEIDERFFIQTKIKDKKETFLSLNEVVIHSGAIAQLIEFDLFIDNIFVYRQKADGLIVNSPTGSTAYSLSGGGPIVHPNLNAITLLPMFPHSLSSSPLIVGADSSIQIKISDKNTSAQLSFDSHNSMSLKGIQEINICKSKSMLKLVHPIDHDFYDGCRNKLGWSSNITNLEKQNENSKT